MYMNMYFSYRMGDGAREIMKVGEAVIGKDASRLMCWPHTRDGCHSEPEQETTTSASVKHPEPPVVLSLRGYFSHHL